MKKYSALCRIAVLLLMVTVVAGVSPIALDVDCSYAAKKAKLNKTIIHDYVGSTINLKVKGTKKKVKWSSTDTKVAKVSKKGKVSLTNTGKCIIKARVGGKTLKCKVVSEDHPSFNGMIDYLSSVSEIGTTYKTLSSKYTLVNHVQTDSFHCFENRDNSFEFDFIGTVPGEYIEYWDDLDVGDSDKCSGMHGTAKEMMGLTKPIPLQYFKQKTGLKIKQGSPEHAPCLMMGGTGMTAAVTVNGEECEMFFQHVKRNGTISPKTKVFLQLIM